MAASDDPFGLGADRGRTRVRQPPPGRPRAVRQAEDTVPLQPRDHPNPLVAAFAPVLAFAPELESATAPSDPEFLRTRLLDGVIAGRDAAAARGVPLARADAAAWAVAALIDDLALNTPWGGPSEWPRQPLVSTLYGDVDAGTRFFERLEELERHPGRDPEMLQLYVFCLELGFRGKYRVVGRAGASSLAAVRTAAARLMRDPEAAAAPLSPNWQGVVAGDVRQRAAVPVWVLFAGAVVLCAALYLLLSLRIAGQSEALAETARGLPPAERAQIYRAVRDTRPVAVAPAVEAMQVDLWDAFAKGAPADLARVLKKGDDTVSMLTLVVQWPKPELFQSARASLTPLFEPLITAIGRVIADNEALVGAVTVVGHTDSIQVGASNPFRSNQGLSEARAETVARLLVANGAPADRVRAEGHAALEPVAPDDTSANRALNRRVEIRVEKRF